MSTPDPNDHTFERRVREADQAVVHGLSSAHRQHLPHDPSAYSLAAVDVITGLYRDHERQYGRDTTTLIMDEVLARVSARVDALLAEREQGAAPGS